jgi:transcriptional regulator with XRE-family HTH domain
LQREFAEEVGVEIRTVKGWESPRMERGAPSWENAVRIAEITGGVYPPELFAAPAPLEETIAQEILEAIRVIERRLAAIERRLR